MLPFWRMMRRILLGCASLCVCFVCATDVTFLMCYRPDHPEDPTTKQILAFAQQHPEIHPLPWGALTLPGAGGRATFMLALAGGSAPDIYKAWFHILRHDIEEGFCYPLNEWMNADGSGWPGWKDVPPLWQKVATRNGKIYALPTPGIAYYGIIYRKDLVRLAGLNAEQPPTTWDEFAQWCMRLTKKGQRAFALENRPWGFLPWVGAAGGDVICSTTNAPGFRACFDSEPCVQAGLFIQRLIASGVVRTLPELSLHNEVADLFVQGEIVSVFGGEDLVNYLTERLNFPADQIGLMPFPAADTNHLRVVQAHKHFYAMTEGVGRREKTAREAVWACLKTLASSEVADETVRKNVAEGRARWCLPRDLKRLGLSDYLSEIPPEIQQLYADLEAGRIRAVTEPSVGFWQAASDLLSRRFLSLLLSGADPSFQVRPALEAITQEANRGLMFDADREVIIRRRPLARVVAGIFLICVMICGVLLRRRARGKNVSLSVSAKPSRTRCLLPWLFLLPALLSIALWSYWPLIRGALMAFQDYRLVGSSAWQGLDNFIRLSGDPVFWKSGLRTLEYVGITLSLGFLTPIVLALLLSEIPRGKVLFRTLYFLPHLTSALVITLLWKMMFDPTENGLLNQLLQSLGCSPCAWLQDPAWAMVCCIVPGVWAGAGISSLLYVAALQSLPPDYYEAAALDGAGVWGRFYHITLPQLAPLMVINFVGAFIAAFQGMGSIFLLTFGGPGDATNVLSLLIWKEAYNNLRFSTATTMAWFLGVALIGFTCLQIRFLRRVEFRQASVN